MKCLENIVHIASIGKFSGLYLECSCFESIEEYETSVTWVWKSTTLYLTVQLTN